MSSKPIIHIVNFTMKPTFDLVEATKLLGVMKRTIPGLLSLEFGSRDTKPFEGYLDRSNGVTHTLVSTHSDEAALKVYTNHPDHLVFVKYVRENAAAPPMAVDFRSRL